ncbi:MAG: Uma2 family endonuclease [Nocardia sp.]|nr:Uma2 family endonuclease [Nocardia sp.]
MSSALDLGSAFGQGPYVAADLHNCPEEGKGFELWNGWLIEKTSPSLRHNRMSRGLRSLFVDAARRAGADVLVDGGEYEFAFPTAVRKPDVFVLDSKAEESGFAEGGPASIHPTYCWSPRWCRREVSSNRSRASKHSTSIRGGTSATPSSPMTRC